MAWTFTLEPRTLVLGAEPSGSMVRIGDYPKGTCIEAASIGRESTGELLHIIEKRGPKIEEDGEISLRIPFETLDGDYLMVFLTVGEPKHTDD